MKKAGKGIFAKKSLSEALSAICGAKTLARTVKPDAKLKAVFPVASIDMLKMPGYISKHLS